MFFSQGNNIANVAIFTVKSKGKTKDVRNIDMFGIRSNNEIKTQSIIKRIIYIIFVICKCIACICILYTVKESQ